LRWLQPDLARIHLGSLRALHVSVAQERIYGGVYAVRCLPVRFPREYISLRFIDHDKREVEVGLLRRLDDWPAEVQELIEASLCKRYFVHGVRAIRTIEQLGAYLKFEVDTDLGPMEFIMRWQSDRAQDYGANGKMLLDTEDNRFLIANVNDLSDDDRTLFQRYIYW
jgi:hypothetical protein